MEKTKRKARQFLQLDRLGQRILNAARNIARRRKARAARSFERRLLPLS